MMTVLFIRVFFVMMSIVVGYTIGTLFAEAGHQWPLVGAGCGLIIATLIIIFEVAMKRVSVRNLSAAVFGLMFGLFMGWIVTSVARLIPMDDRMFSALQLGIILTFCYLGMVMAIRGKDEFNLIIPYVKFTRQHQGEDIIILDTSVIIDGRIADICQTKFFTGRFIIPRFILKELQQVADSQDSLKRTRGRRGLDILRKVQKNTNIDVKIHDEDFPDIKEVDSKLVKLAKVLNGKIFTNDYNLNKVAELQGVEVLNINELANALKSVVLPGEELDARITKEGKEHNQGVAYLDDGTMVVVDNARHLIGKMAKIAVTSVLQTSAGRMIFGKIENKSKSTR